MPCNLNLLHTSTPLVNIVLFTALQISDFYNYPLLHIKPVIPQPLCLVKAVFWPFGMFQVSRSCHQFHKGVFSLK